MAFTNWIQPNTYTHISNINYNKKEMTVTCELITYEDSSKKNELQKQTIRLTGDKLVEQVSGLVSEKPNDIQTQTKEIPIESNELWLCDMQDHQPCIFYIDTLNPKSVYAPDTVGDANSLPEPIAYTWIWEKRFVVQEDYFQTPDKQFYKITNNQELQTCSQPMTEQVWNDWFGIESVSLDGNNLSKLIYLYLKTQPLFNGVIDA